MHGFPSARYICWAPRSISTEATVASVLMNLGTQQMYLADGNPCSAPYRELDYREFLAKRSTVAEPAL